MWIICLLGGLFALLFLVVLGLGVLDKILNV